MVDNELSKKDLTEYLKIFHFKVKVNRKNIRKIFFIYFSLLNSINRSHKLGKNIKKILDQRFFNAIGKNFEDVSFSNIISEAINHRVLGLGVKSQLWAIYKAKFQGSE